MPEVFMRLLIYSFIITGFAIILICCDIYENENKDWENEVTIYFKNLTHCPVEYYLDGVSKGEIDPEEDFLEDELGQGIHLLEAYPWNDEQHACDFFYTEHLKSSARFDWILDASSPCDVCKPTPTPAPTSVISPSPTIPPTATPEPTE